MTQGERLQDSIDKYKEKIRLLKKRKSGEKKQKLHLVDSEEESIIIPPTQPFSKHANF